MRYSILFGLLVANLVGCNCGVQDNETASSATTVQPPATEPAQPTSPAESVVTPATTTTPTEPVHICAQGSGGCGPSPYPLPANRRFPVSTEPATPCAPNCHYTFGPVTY